MKSCSVSFAGNPLNLNNKRQQTNLRKRGLSLSPFFLLTMPENMKWNDSDHCTNQDIMKNCHQRGKTKEGVESSVEGVASR